MIQFLLTYDEGNLDSNVIFRAVPIQAVFKPKFYREKTFKNRGGSVNLLFQFEEV